MLTMDIVTKRALLHLRRDLILNALDDFVPLSAVSWEVRERLNPESEATTLKLAISVVTDLIGVGMLQVGDLVDGRVVPWQASSQSMLGRIEAALTEDATSERGWLIATDKTTEWAKRYGEVLEQLIS